jgi:hypothetical protein
MFRSFRSNGEFLPEKFCGRNCGDEPNLTLEWQLFEILSKGCDRFGGPSLLQQAESVGEVRIRHGFA